MNIYLYISTGPLLPFTLKFSKLVHIHEMSHTSRALLGLGTKYHRKLTPIKCHSTQKHQKSWQRLFLIYQNWTHPCLIMAHNHQQQILLSKSSKKYNTGQWMELIKHNRHHLTFCVTLCHSYPHKRRTWHTHIVEQGVQGGGSPPCSTSSHHMDLNEFFLVYIYQQDHYYPLL